MVGNLWFSTTNTFKPLAKVNCSVLPNLISGAGPAFGRMLLSNTVVGAVAFGAAFFTVFCAKLVEAIKLIAAICKIIFFMLNIFVV